MSDENLPPRYRLRYIRTKWDRRHFLPPTFADRMDDRLTAAGSALLSTSRALARKGFSAILKSITNVKQATAKWKTKIKGKNI